MPGEGDGRAQARGKSHGCQVVRSDSRADEWPDEWRDGTMDQRILAHCTMVSWLPSHRQSAFFVCAAYTLCVLAALHRLRQVQRPQELGDYVWLESCVDWSGRRDSNPRPSVPQTDALPGCATARYFEPLVAWFLDRHTVGTAFDQVPNRVAQGTLM